MKSKKMLVGLPAVVALALAVLPAAASAEIMTTPTLDRSVDGEPYAGGFTASGGEGNLYGEGLPEVHCESSTGSGEFENGMTGTAIVRFHGCTAFEGLVECTSAAQAPGTIKTEVLGVHLAYLEPTNEGDPHETPGIVLTPVEEGGFSEFNCGKLVTFEVKGNGAAGTVTNPGDTSEGITNLIATSEGQQHTTVTTAEGESEAFGLEASTDQENYVSTYVDAGSITVVFEEDVTLETG